MRVLWIIAVGSARICNRKHQAVAGSASTKSRYIRRVLFGRRKGHRKSAIKHEFVFSLLYVERHIRSLMKLKNTHTNKGVVI